MRLSIDRVEVRVERAEERARGERVAGLIGQSGPPAVDDDLDVGIDRVIIDLGEGGAGDEALAHEITAAILASLGRLDLEA